MTKKQKLRKILNKLDPKPKVEIREVVKVVEKIVEKPAKSDLPFLFKVVKKVISLSSNQKKETAKIKDSIQAVKEELKAEVKQVEGKIPEIPKIPEVNLTPLEERIEDVRQEMFRRSQGGGQAHRDILVNSSIISRKYADVNFTGTITATEDNTNKRVDLDFSAVGGVDSVFGRTGTVVAVAGDYTTDLVTEGTNLYFTNARAVSAMSGLYEVPLTFGDGLTRTGNDIDLDTTVNILKISGLTSNGFVKTSGGDGTLSIDTTTYEPADATILKDADIGVSVQAYDADLTSWAGVTRASGFDTFVATPSSANLLALVTDETGSGLLVFGTSPTLTTPVIAGGTITLSVDTDIITSGGVNGLSIDGTTFSVDGTNDRIGIGTAAPSAKFDLVAGTLDGGIEAFNMSYTLDSSAGGENIGALWTITTAGSEAVTQRGIKLLFNAGYTGASQNVPIRVESYVAGTGNSLSSLGFTGNGAASYNAIGASLAGGGLNVGSHGNAANGLVNIGSVGLAGDSEAGQTNYGVRGIAHASGAGSLAFGGHFSLDNTTTDGAGLAASNTTLTRDIFRGYDNTTIVFVIADGGNVGIGTSTFGTSAAKVLAISGSTAPSSSPADIVQLWSADTVAGQANLYSRNENGKSEQLTGLADRVSTQFDKTNNTLADITGLSHNVEAGKAYSFEVTLFTTSNVAAGIKAAIAGTATATLIRYESLVIQTGTTVATTASRSAALGGTVADVTAVTVATIKIWGTITVNAAGTLTVQFAQNATNAAASSVLTNSTFILKAIGD